MEGGQFVLSYMSCCSLAAGTLSGSAWPSPRELGHPIPEGTDGRTHTAVVLLMSPHGKHLQTLKRSIQQMLIKQQLQPNRQKQNKDKLEGEKKPTNFTPSDSDKQTQCSEIGCSRISMCSQSSADLHELVVVRAQVLQVRKHERKSF